MNRDTWDSGEEVLTDVQRLNTLLAKENYSETVKAKIKTILDKYQFANRNLRNRPFTINEVRQKLYKAPNGGGGVEVVASGRKAWIGWVELTKRELDPVATAFTGRVINAVDADVLCTIEVEDRISLSRFNQLVLNNELGAGYPYNLCIDGNDDRGIDVGLLSKYPIESVRSHIHDSDGDGTIFSRDCAEFEIELPSGRTLWVLANHFKSKGYGSAASSNKKRARQAKRVAEIYLEARKRSDFVAVLGDLNDVPDSAPLQPLLQGTDLRDICEHDKWSGPIGTYGTGRAKSSKIDYVLLSPDLWKRVKAVGIERRGIYAPSLGIMWPGVTKATAASDHAAIWVDLNV